MGIRTITLVAAALLALPALGETKLNYPDTKKIDHKDTYHGTEVADPYRWLEDDVRESKDVRAWVDAQNKVTFAYLEKLPTRAAIETRLTKVWNYERQSVPVKKGARYFFTKNSGLQNQSVLYVQESLVDEPRVLLDPNTLSKDGTVALSDTEYSDDGRYMAYSLAEAGSDWTTWKVMDVDSGKTLPDEIRWVKFSGASWTKDGKGFFYSRYTEPQSGATFQSLNKNQKIYYHRLGTPQSDDVVVYHRPDHPDWSMGGVVSEDGRYLVIDIGVGTDPRNQLLYKDLEEPYGMPVPLVEDFDNEYSFVGNEGPVLYFKSDLNAPLRRLIAIDVRKPERGNWREIVPQAKHLLEDVDYVGNLFVAQYLEDARSAVKIFTSDGKHVRDVPFDTLGTASGFAGSRDDSETFYTFESFTVPPSIYRYDVATGEQTLIRRAKVDFDSAQFDVKQVFYQSKDGTCVPMFVAHRKGLVVDGSNPTLLYGYGGFNQPMVPKFSPSRLVWMQMGGVLAIANLRGGNEYGEEWHKAGTKLQKQNVFDDFIAAAEWLIANKYTTSEKLAIQGGSNGGLLVGAVMTQRPELFGAALPQVGVMDMLRFHRFTAGRFWTDDYGSADDPAEFKALYAYSPYHNLKKADYPATLVTTADTDDRVVPGHSFKFAARLQEMQTGSDPVLIRIETRAGHGAGKPVSKTIEEVADSWAFLAANLGMELPPEFD
ncbi:MAG: prolyl oligopeptidase family serine peptidase [Thermoanaerobaculia bacterium]